MYHFTVPMALMDFIPVAFFGVSGALLLQDLYNKMSRGVYTLLSAGALNVFLAGFCKALWKLLYAAGICDLVALEQMFMPVNSIGLLLTGVSLICMLCQKSKGRILSVAPPVFAGSMPFIMMMVVGLGSLCVGLSVISVKMKRGFITALFVLSFVSAMAMGYLASQDMTLAWVNWAEQSINGISQGCLMAGVIALHKAGLKEWTQKEEIV